MNEQLKDKLRKIYELINRGATEGEKAAAKNALDKIVKKYNIDETMLSEIELKQYRFYYGSDMEKILILQVARTFAPSVVESFRRGTKYLVAQMGYADYITVDSAYEYYRRHMKVQWNKLCAEKVRACRKAKTKAKKRKYLQDIFITQYLIKSNLIQQKYLTTVKVASNSDAMERMRLLYDVEGGEFKRQIVSSYLLKN